MKRVLLVFASVLAMQAQAQTKQLFDNSWQFTREGKTITVTFNPAKTDTIKLKKAINKLGYEAVVIDYKIIK